MVVDKLKQWELATQNLVNEFAKKHYSEDPYTFWVADEVGGVFHVNDDWYSLDRIVEALRYDATYKQLQDYAQLEEERSFDIGLGNTPKTLANFKNFVKHGIAWV